MSDLIAISCPGCGAKFRVSESTEKKKADCKKCGCIMVIPKLIAEAKASDSAVPTREASKPLIKRRATGAAEENEKPAGRGRGRRTTSSGKGPRTTRGRREAVVDESEDGARRRRPKNDNQQLMILSIVAGVLILGIVLFFVLGNDDEKVDKTDTQSSQLKSNGDEDDSDSEIPDDSGGTAADDTEAEVKQPEKPVKKPVKKRVKKPADDPKYATRFDPIKGTSSEEEKAIKANVIEIMDPDSRAFARARRDLVNLRKKSLPYLINALMELDPAVEKDTGAGFQIMTAISRTMDKQTGDRDSWWQVHKWEPESEDGKYGLTSRYRSQIYWWGWWDTKGKTWEYKAPELKDDL